MANSKYDYHKEDEKLTDLRFNRGTYIIVRVDGDKFHNFSSVHDFHKPNDKRALDLMVESAKQVMRTYKGNIPLAYGHSDEFSFLIKSTSQILSRRVFKITSMLVSVFTAYYNSNWSKFFQQPKKYDAWFDARPKEYPDYSAVIDYFRWRQVDCHINNLYNTTLHALTGRYLKHVIIHLPDGSCEIEKTPITRWISDTSKFSSSRIATEKLSGTVSSEKHEILFSSYGINYNQELEQFKKGTIIVDEQSDYTGKNEDPSSIKEYYVDITKNLDFWEKHRNLLEKESNLFSSNQPKK